MAWFMQKVWDDWCHICGTRQGNNVEIVYPNNAEHQFLSEGGKGSGGGNGKSLRICADCGETIVRIGRREMKEDVRNNPALVTAHLAYINPRFKPELN